MTLPNTGLVLRNDLLFTLARME